MQPNPIPLHDFEGPRESPITSPGNIRHDYRDDDISVDSTWTESTTVPRRNLGFVQCSALMINQMVGTGIFTLPGLVLLLTKSKPVATALWAAGGVYSLLSVLIYLEFGTALPYNGGALIYLDEIFHRPNLLAAVIFSFFWILLSSTSGNCIVFAQYALRVAHHDAPVAEIDDRLIRFLGVVVQTVVCLMLYFLRRFCFMVNNIFALFKIILLLVIAGAGFRSARWSNSGTPDWGNNHPNRDTVDALSAMVYILYSYQGWEHTNYIAGEIKAPKETLRNAAFFSVTLVTVLYILASSAFYAFASYSDITGPNLDLGVAALLGETVFGITVGVRVCITISAFSCLLANTYTTTKVKQAIAWQRFIPFSDFFGRQDRQFDSPGGALVLHWIFSVIEICIADSKTDTYSFIIGIFAYGYSIMMVFLGVGVFFLKKRMETISDTHDWKPIYMSNKLTLYTVVFVFIGINLLMVVITAMPDSPGTIPRYYWPITVLTCVAAGALYWCGLKALQVKFGEHRALGACIGLEVNVYNEGDEGIPDNMKNIMADALIDGSRRRVTYKVSLNHLNPFLSAELTQVRYQGLP
ncbi:amino acid transporter [Pyrenochaeta sp. DS3sAY3a]|nr:amino acid transporter [Pyrenochaeta sp. DS3sAY3a]